MAKRNHPDYYYTIRDAIVAEIGPAEFDPDAFKHLFPKVARRYGVIPWTDGYLAHRRIIGGLVKSTMKQRFAAMPKTQTALI